MIDIVKAFQKFTPRLTEGPDLARKGIPRETLDVLGEVLDKTDQELYGMPFELLQRVVHDPKLQRNFKIDFGISFVEYLERKASGEVMGVTQVNGKWSSLK